MSRSRFLTSTLGRTHGSAHHLARIVFALVGLALLASGCSCSAVAVAADASVLDAGVDAGRDAGRFGRLVITIEGADVDAGR